MGRFTPGKIRIIELLITVNRRFSSNVALQIKEGDSFRALTYTRLGIRISGASSHLIKLGVEKGDRIAILSESRPEWSIAIFGIISCAGIAVPMDTKLSDNEIEFILNDCQAKCIFVSKKLLDTILRVRPKLQFIQKIICLDKVSVDGVLSLNDFRVEKEISHRDIQPEDTALIVYTSGTTGVAKGVQITYNNLLRKISVRFIWM